MVGRDHVAGPQGPSRVAPPPRPRRFPPRRQTDRDRGGAGAEVHRTPRGILNRHVVWRHAGKSNGVHYICGDEDARERIEKAAKTGRTFRYDDLGLTLSGSTRSRSRRSRNARPPVQVFRQSAAHTRARWRGTSFTGPPADRARSERSRQRSRIAAGRVRRLRRTPQGPRRTSRAAWWSSASRRRRR